MTEPTRLLQAVQRMPVLAVSGASITLNSSALRRLVDVTTGASDSAVTLPTSGVRDGDMLFMRKADTGAGKVNVNSNMAWLMTQGDVVQFMYTNSAWWALDWRIYPLRQVFLSTAYYTLPPLSRYVYPKLIGAGGGAGSGRKGAAGSVRCGGGGAQAGGYSERLFRAELLGAPLTQVQVAIGAFGVGGSSQTANSTNGNIGVSGSPTSFGTLLIAQGGSPGNGGTTSGGSGGSNNGVGLAALLFAPGDGFLDRIGKCRRAKRLQNDGRVGGAIHRLQARNRLDIAGVGNDRGDGAKLFEFGCHIE